MKFTSFKLAMAAVGTAMVAALGGWDDALRALILLISADYLSGVLVALRERRLNSTVGIAGIVKKVGMLVLVVAAHTMDGYLVMGAPWARTATIMFLITNEGISILENLSRLGVPIPSVIREALAKGGPTRE